MILSEFYEKTMARITSKVTSIKHHDYYMDQYIPDQQGNIEPFMCPATLFEYDPSEFTALGKRSKLISLNWRLHYVSEVIQEVRKSESPAIRNKAHEHLDVIDELVKALDGYYDDTLFGTISITGVEPFAFRADKLVVHILSFKNTIKYQAATPVMVAPATPPELVITTNNQSND